MAKSMTGYGSDTFQIKETSITVEIKSINSRYLDISAKIPRSLQEIEYTLKKMLQTHFNRGRIEIYITITGEPLKSRSIFVDWQLLDDYMQKFEEIKSRYNMKGDLPLSTIADQEALFVIQEGHEPDKSFHELLFRSVKRACERVVNTRIQEGEFLEAEVLKRIDYIRKSLYYIETNKETVHRLYRERIKERILEHIDQSISVDQHLLTQEIATFAEKGDIQEEITRIDSHINHFKSVVDKETAVGRKLDFIVQEMHREANTLGSKSIDATISKEIVTMKSEIEKIKEQIQNIE